MEEENNQNQEEQQELPDKIGKQGIDMAKDAARNFGRKKLNGAKKKITGKVVMAIMHFLMPIIIFMLILSIIVGAVYTVFDTISGIASKVRNSIATVLKIGESGTIAPTREEMLSEIEEELANAGISKTNLGLGTEAQTDAYLYKFKMASMATQLPYIKESLASKITDIITSSTLTGGVLQSSEAVSGILMGQTFYDIAGEQSNLQGIVKIKKRTDDGTTKDLNFKTYEAFCEMVENNDTSALNCFAIDDSGESWALYVAKETKTTTDGNTIVTLDKVSIPYETLISNYTMPFSFLINLQQFTNCPEYVSAVADMIMKDGEIELTIFESKETRTTTTTTEKTKEQLPTSGLSSAMSEMAQTDGTASETTDTSEEGEEEGSSDPIVSTTTTEITTISADVTKADVWVINKKAEYKLNKPEDPTYPLGPNGQTSIVDGVTTTVMETVTTSNWVEQSSEMKVEPDKFLGLWKNTTGYYIPEAKFKPNGKIVKYYAPLSMDKKSPLENLQSAKEWFYETLEKKEETQLHAKIMRELITYYEKGGDYEIDVDFSIFDTTSFNDVLGLYGNNSEERIWFALLDAGYDEYAVAGAMGNIKQESGFATNNVEECVNQKSGLSDAEFTEQVNSGKISKDKFIECYEWGEIDKNGKPTGRYGYGLAQWTWPSYKEELYDLAKSKGVGIESEELQIEYLLKHMQNAGYSKTQSSPSDAAYKFHSQVERSADGPAKIQNRMDSAEEIYKKYHGMEKPQGGDFYALAKQLHDYVKQNQYWYPSAQNLAAGKYVSDGTSVKHKIPTIGEPENQRYIDCSAYVSWVISEYTGKKQLYSASNLLNNPMGFKEVSLSSLQPGDIVVRSGHTEIYAGNGKSLNCGSTNAIRSEYSNYSGNFTKAFRAPSKGNDKETAEKEEE